jgi:SAM-dependent methyltransferase
MVPTVLPSSRPAHRRRRGPAIEIASPFDRSAPLYDAIYAARGKDYRAEAGWIAAVVDEEAQAAARTLLDLGCGTGEHLRHLAGRFEVTGVDRNLAMLTVARAKLPEVALVVADMTTLALPRRFDVIISMFASIAYVDDEESLAMAARSVARHLAPGGIALIEPGLAPEQVRPPSVAIDTAVVGGTTVTRRTSARRRPEALAIDFEFSVEAPDASARYRERHNVKLFTNSAYSAAFGRAGLIARYDGDGPAGRGMWILRAPR